MLMMTGVRNGMTAMMTHHTKNESLFSFTLWGVPLNRHPTRCFFRGGRVVVESPNNKNQAYFLPFYPLARSPDDVTLISVGLCVFPLTFRALEREIPKQLTWSSCCVHVLVYSGRVRRSVAKKRECYFPWGFWVYNLETSMFIYFDCLLNHASESSSFLHRL